MVCGHAFRVVQAQYALIVTFLLDVLRFYGK